MKDLHFKDTDEFTYKDDGLNIAIAFTAFDNTEEWMLDATYGELEINSYEWGYDEDGKPFTARKPLNVHNCTREELNLGAEPSEARFYDLHESSRYTVDFYWQKFLCIDPEDLRVSGDYNSETARQVNIQLKKCNGTGCKTDDQIKEYFRNKFMLMLVNEGHFVTDGFGEQRVKQEARVQWLRINSYAPQTIPMQIMQSELQLQDQLFNFADITKEKDQ